MRHGWRKTARMMAQKWRMFFWKRRIVLKLKQSWRSVDAALRSVEFGFKQLKLHIVRLTARRHAAESQFEASGRK